MVGHLSLHRHEKNSVDAAIGDVGTLLNLYALKSLNSIERI